MISTKSNTFEAVMCTHAVALLNAMSGIVLISDVIFTSVCNTSHVC